jgi:hypothetical protein
MLSDIFLRLLGAIVLTTIEKQIGMVVIYI